MPRAWLRWREIDNSASSTDVACAWAEIKRRALHACELMSMFSPEGAAGGGVEEAGKTTRRYLFRGLPSCLYQLGKNNGAATI